MKPDCNILIAGVGGQGSLICGRILSEVALKSDLRPIIGETFGASRRGGTVLTHLRLDHKDRGPLIPKGEADIILGLEPLETLRAAVDFSGSNTVILLSTVRVDTTESLAKKREYPAIEEILKALSKLSGRVIPLNPSKSLKRVASMRMLNSYMLGALSVLEENPLDKESVREKIRSMLRNPEMNLAAFDAGVAEASE
ncbi:MAG: 2-oxoacid:acceptor oxidoreductase family protein [Candidatus Thorarchaeota archaeon]